MFESLAGKGGRRNTSVYVLVLCLSGGADHRQCNSRALLSTEQTGLGLEPTIRISSNQHQAFIPETNPRPVCPYPVPLHPQFRPKFDLDLLPATTAGPMSVCNCQPSRYTSRYGCRIRTVILSIGRLEPPLSGVPFMGCALVCALTRGCSGNQSSISPVSEDWILERGRMAWGA